MDVFLSALGAVATLFIFVAGGFVFRKRKIVDAAFSGTLSAMVFKFFYPMLMLRIVLLQTDMETIMGSMYLVAISVIIMALGLPVGLIFSRAARGARSQEAPCRKAFSSGGSAAFTPRRLKTASAMCCAAKSASAAWA